MFNLSLPNLYLTNLSCFAHSKCASERLVSLVYLIPANKTLISNSIYLKVSKSQKQNCHPKLLPRMNGRICFSILTVRNYLKLEMEISINRVGSQFKTKYKHECKKIELLLQKYYNLIMLEGKRKETQKTCQAINFMKSLFSPHYSHISIHSRKLI